MRGGGAREADPAVDALIEAARREERITSRRIGAEDITARALPAMANEACLLLAEGVALRAGDVDVALVNGYGFPGWEGGPVFRTRERESGKLGRDLDRLAEVGGPGFARGDARHLATQAGS